MLVEGVITFIIVASLFYVAPGILGTIASGMPQVNATTQPALAASQTSIGTLAGGGLSIAAIAVIMMGVALMIGGFYFIKRK